MFIDQLIYKFGLSITSVSKYIRIYIVVEMVLIYTRSVYNSELHQKAGTLLVNRELNRLVHTLRPATLLSDQ